MAAMQVMRHIIAGEAPVQVPSVYKDFQRLDADILQTSVGTGPHARWQTPQLSLLP